MLGNKLFMQPEKKMSFIKNLFFKVVRIFHSNLVARICVFVYSLNWVACSIIDSLFLVSTASCSLTFSLLFQSFLTGVPSEKGKYPLFWLMVKKEMQIR